VTLLPDGTVAVLDTYNGAVRRYDPATRTVDTLARNLAEPTGAVVVGDELVVVESAAHRLTRLPLRRTVDVGPGEVTVTVAFTPPPGETLDDRYGPATSLTITGLAGGASQGPELTRRIRVGTEQRLRASAYAASCDERPSTRPATWPAGTGTCGWCRRPDQGRASPRPGTAEGTSRDRSLATSSGPNPAGQPAERPPSLLVEVGEEPPHRLRRGRCESSGRLSRSSR
jgi:hypothetical protein